ncbi:hypothetical protein GF356_05940 [candidate division GN15 bacterium]|nr:hypothetical protein [candidate division GN15 bacterium]
MARSICITCLLLLLLGDVVGAQKTTDSTEVITDTTLADTTEVDTTVVDTLADTTIVDTLLPSDSADSVRVADSLFLADSLQTEADTLTEAERAYQGFQERWEEHQLTQAPPFVYLSAYDTLVSWFTSQHLNHKRDVARSWYHDAGDFFRFDPSYFVLNHQVTPMRSTVSPYGLHGDRVEILMNDKRYMPFEHIVEPDGMVDMNDVMTVNAEDIFVLPGALGQLFGGRQSISTLMTRSERPDTYDPVSVFKGEEGGLAYSHVRASLTKWSSIGRRANGAVQYREADGPFAGRFDDGYHLWGDYYTPVGKRYAVGASGFAYTRDGRFYVRPEAAGTSYSRYRFDRRGWITLDRHNEDFTARNALNYTHLRQGSYADGSYTARFDKTGHALSVSREAIGDEFVWKADAGIDYLEYAAGPRHFYRSTAHASLTRADLSSGWRWAFNASARYNGDNGFLPSAAVVLMRESEGSLMLLSAGYSTREPSLHQLHLEEDQFSIYQQADSYIERGNPDLDSEKQLVGNVMLVLGSLRTNLELSAAAGQMSDAIEWRHSQVEGTSTALFEPINTGITFVSTTGRARLALGNVVDFLGGVSWRNVDYDSIEVKPYQPRFQAFSGLQLHLHWPQKGVHFYGYGELVYSDNYDGYSVQNLGNTAVVNVRLTIGLKDFEWHFVFQNITGLQYRAREHMTYPGRFTYYGLTWRFFD